MDSGHTLERDEERAEIEAVLDRAAASTGTLLVIEGPAGIGKTRLVNEAREAATRRSMSVGRARGSNLEQDFAFGAARQLLEPLIRAALGGDGLFSGAAAAAAPVLGAGETGFGDAPGAVIHGLYWLTAALAESGPLALFCDDAHWFDAPSLRFVAYLAHRLEEHPIALVVATRPSEPGPEGELLDRLVAEQGAVRLRPAPLSDHAVSQLVRSSLETPADETFCSAVAEASRGNPFLVGELVRAARASELAPSGASASRVTEMAAGPFVLGRLGRLSPEAQEVARAVAVLGIDAHLRHVAALAGLQTDDAGVAADTLLRAEILGPDRPLAFVHPLVESAVYNELLPGDRASRHRQAAALLRDEGAPPDRLATHLMAVEPAGDAAVVDVLTAAARSALAAGATDVAISYLRRALAEPPPSSRRAAVVLELGAAEAFVTNPGAIEHLGEAIKGIEDVATRLVLTTVRSLALAFEHRPAEAIAALNELAADVAGDRALELQLLAATVLVGMTGPTATPLVADRIAELRQAVNAGSDAPPSVLGVRAFVGAFANEPAAEMADLAARALAMIPADDPTLPLSFHLPLTALVMADRDAEAATIIDDGLAIARRLGAPAHLGVTLFFRAWIALRAGELDDAEADASAALEVLQLHSVDFVVPGPVAILVEVLRERDDLEGADALLIDTGYESGDGDSLFHLFLLRARARLRGAQRRWDEAFADLERAIERTEENGCQSPGFLPLHADVVVAHSIAGRQGESTRAHAEMAMRTAEAFGAPRALAEGIRAVALTDPAADAELAQRAVAMFAEMGAMIEESRTIIGLVATRRWDATAGTATEQLSRALELAERCGNARLATLARAELRALGARPGRVAVTGVGSLTPSERRTALLAAAGRTNKEVAQELFVTVKTVESHLARAYQKLQITSRRELGDALSA